MRQSEMADKDQSLNPKSRMWFSPSR